MNTTILCLLFASTLSLEDALKQLEMNNPSLQQSRARIQEAAALARQALSQTLPQLAVTGGYTRNRDEARAPLGQLASVFLPPGATPPADLIIQPLEVWSVAATARVPIVVAHTWLELSSSYAALEATAAQSGVTRMQLRSSLIQTAWMARAAREIVGASERALKNAEEHAASVKRASDAGTGTSLAVLQASTESVRRKSDLAQARVEADRLALAAGVLLGQSEPVQITISEHSESTATLSRDRPDLRAARWQLKAAERQVTAAWLRLVPQVQATGALFKQSVALPTGRDDGWRIGLELSWAIYDGGFRYGKERQARAQREGAEAALHQAELRVSQEVTDATAQLGLARERHRLADEQLRLATEAAATAKRGFAAGVSSALDVREANDRLYQAEVAVASGSARVGAAVAALEFAATGDSK